MRVLIPFLLFLISFGVYLKTLCPTVYVGDSGELIAAAYTLGIAHPPGYPLYCLMAKLFTFLPFGSVAYRINLMSAFFASLTVVLIYLIVLKLSTIDYTTIRPSDYKTKTPSPILNHIPAISASLLFAFSSTFWSQAVVAEVYTLNTFFLALSIFVLLKWREALPTPNSELQTPNSTRYLYSFSLIYGLSLTHHYIMGLFAPIFILFILWTRPKIIKEVKTLFLMLGLFLLPLTVYFYLPIRSLANPPIDWGNPENWPNFLAHIRRLQYHGLEFVREIPLKDKGLFISDFLRRLSRQFTPFLFWLGMVGIWRIFKKYKRFFSLSLLIFFANSLGLIFLLHFLYNPGTSFQFSVYYLPAYLIFSLWMGYGIEYLLKRGEKVNRKIDFGGKSIYRYVAPLLIFFLPLLPLSRNYFYNDRSRHYLAYDYGMNILKTLEKDAILFTSGDNPTFTTAYLTMVDKKRPDVTIYHRNGSLYQDIYGFSQLPRKELTAEKKSRRRSRIEKKIISNVSRPVYYIRDVSGELSDYSLKPEGLLYRVQREGTEIEDDHNYWKDYQMRGIENERIFKDYSTRGVIAEYCYHIGIYYSRNKKREEAITAYLQAQRAGWIIDGGHIKLGLAFQKEGAIEEAIQEFARAVELDPQLISGYSNLGACYALKGQYQKAEGIWKKALSIDPENEKAQKNLEKLKGIKDKQ